MNRIVVGRTCSKIVRSPVFIVSTVLLASLVFASGTSALGSMLSAAILATVPLVFGAGVITSEDGRGLLPLVLTRPIGRTHYLVSRVAGVLAGAAVLFVNFAILIVVAALFRQDSPAWRPILHAGTSYLTSSFLAVAFLAAAAMLVHKFYNIGCYVLVLVLFMQGLGALVILAPRIGLHLSPWLTEGAIVPAIGRAFFLGLIGSNRSVLEHGVTIAAGIIMLGAASILFERRDIRPTVA